MRDIKKDNRGIAAIIIVTAVITIIMLIVTGFASIAAREQRQALDQQLSLQARYAAESVINDKIAQFRANPASVSTTPDCIEQGQQTFTGETEIFTTCVLVDATPNSQEFSNVSNSDSTLVWLDPGSSTVDRIIITWERPLPDSAGDCSPDSHGVFPSDIPTSRIDMLRFDLSYVGPQVATNFNRDGVRKNTMSGVLHPRNGNSGYTESFTSSSTAQPKVFGACGDPTGNLPSSTPQPKKAFAVIDIPNSSDKYILRLKGIYKNSSVSVTGVDAVGDTVEYENTQISLEATVRVTDIVQKVNVRVPYGAPPADLIPDYALHVSDDGDGDLCSQAFSYPSRAGSGGNFSDSCHPNSLRLPPSLPLPAGGFSNSSGCTDSSAFNFNPNADIDDGNCSYTPIVYGCTNPTSPNYNPSATNDDGSCVSATETYTNPGTYFTTIPLGASQVTIRACGAEGGRGARDPHPWRGTPGNRPGGLGACVDAVVDVSTRIGQTLRISVGAKGTEFSNGSAYWYTGGMGGNCSYVRLGSSNYFAIGAGGGGGGGDGYYNNGSPGGAGGIVSGSDGQAGAQRGRGGGNTSAGVGGSPSGGAGSGPYNGFRNGGHGANWWAGHGGCGWYGGGGGGLYNSSAGGGGGGGGGSSFSASGSGGIAGTKSGNGSVTITWN